MSSMIAIRVIVFGCWLLPYWRLAASAGYADVPPLLAVDGGGWLQLVGVDDPG